MFNVSLISINVFMNIKLSDIRLVSFCDILSIFSLSKLTDLNSWRLFVKASENQYWFLLSKKYQCVFNRSKIIYDINWLIAKTHQRYIILLSSHKAYLINNNIIQYAY
jgi:hypothetical protein